MSGEEHATGTGVRMLGTYPPEWGWPAGEQYSEERVDWVRSNVREDVVLNAHRLLAEKNDRLLAILRAADLRRRR
jgi:hypothetical protein